MANIENETPDAKTELPANEALEIIGQKGVNKLPVVKDGQLMGIISQEQILNYLFTRRELNL